jgi:hypothetical protein
VVVPFAIKWHAIAVPFSVLASRLPLCFRPQIKPEFSIPALADENDGETKSSTFSIVCSCAGISKLISDRSFIQTSDDALALRPEQVTPPSAIMPRSSHSEYSRGSGGGTPKKNRAADPVSSEHSSEYDSDDDRPTLFGTVLRTAMAGAAVVAIAVLVRVVFGWFVSW